MRPLLFLVLITLFSCGEPINRMDILPDSVGKGGEIQVLMTNELWQGPVGKTVQAHFDNYADGVYLRPESIFNYYQLTPDQFEGTLRYTRNVLQVRLRNDTTYAQTTLTEYHDHYARGQLFIQVADSDPKRMLESIRVLMFEVIDIFNKKESERLAKEYNANFHKVIDQSAQEKMGISVHLPTPSDLKVNTDKFIWVKYDRSKTQIAGQNNRFEAGTYWVQQGFLIWETPYTDTSQLSMAGVLANRDSTLKYNVPGKVEGSYMSTEYDEYYSPKSEVYDHDGAYAIKVQGLWKHAGNEAAFGGGPFLQTTIHNKKRNTLVTFCGYIYAPKFDKREYLREIDAIITTIKLM